MIPILSQASTRFRLTVTRALGRLGFGDHAILVPLALVIGVLTSGLAVLFHELIGLVRDSVYRGIVPPDILYGGGVGLLIVFPAAGGLLVALVSRYVMRKKEGHGVVDVIETVLRSRGRINPIVSVEQTLTSAITIGTGGSAGAEGPIVQIGAGVSSFVGQLFQVGKAHLPTLIGCGTAAGISAIFGTPIGGVLFTLEVILLDFSIRAITPIVLASVVAYVSTQHVLVWLHPHDVHTSIFRVPWNIAGQGTLTWPEVPAVAVLGIACGLVGVTLTRAMHRSEELFRRLPVPPLVRPAIGGALLGVIGVAYVMIFGWLVLGSHKPFAIDVYPMPAFYGDGYGVIDQLINPRLSTSFTGWYLVLLLTFLVLAKIVGTCLTLSSGGSGGVIAPSLFLGATVGALVGLLLRQLGWLSDLPVGFLALIGMGAVLAAVVHAPLASILILMEVTDNRDVVLPAMLACVVSTGVARMVSRDSIYTLGLRRRGVLVGTGQDAALLRRLQLDQLKLEPVRAYPVHGPLEALLAGAAANDGRHDTVLVDADGMYVGLAVEEDVRTALLQSGDAVPHLLAEDLARTDVPTVKTTDDLAVAFELFGRYDVTRLPVVLPARPGRVIGLVSRKEVMRRYHETLLER